MLFCVENVKGWKQGLPPQEIIHTIEREKEIERERARERENNSDVDTFYIFPLHTLKHIMKMK